MHLMRHFFDWLKLLAAISADITSWIAGCAWRLYTAKLPRQFRGVVFAGCVSVGRLRRACRQVQA
jgi:hypothetical protein